MNLTASFFSAPLRRSVAFVAAAGSLTFLAACAPMPSGKQEYTAGRARLALPAGDWEDLGVKQDQFTVAPATAGKIPVQTRAVVLRQADQSAAAVLLVQTNQTNYPRERITWTGACPEQQGVLVDDRAGASPVRIDCLRLKSWADQRDWLTKNYPELSTWVNAQKALPAKPYSLLHYRYASETGAFIEVHALVDQRLLRPKPRNNDEFMRADLPARDWSQRLAEAARLSTSMMDGYFAVPPFPLPLTP